MIVSGFREAQLFKYRSTSQLLVWHVHSVTLFGYTFWVSAM